MPYNISPATVERWQAELTKLLSGDEVHFSTSDPYKLAYRLREALESADRLGIEPFTGIKARYEFKADPDKGHLLARPKKPLTEPKPTVLPFPGITTAFDLVSVAAEASASVLQFPNFSGNIEMVRSWANKNNWALDEGPPLQLSRE